MEVFRAIIMIGVKGACQSFPLRWIGCFDYRLDSVDQLVHACKGFLAHFSLFDFPGYDLIRPNTVQRIILLAKAAPHLGQHYFE